MWISSLKIKPELLQVTIIAATLGKSLKESLEFGKINKLITRICLPRVPTFPGCSHHMNSSVTGWKQRHPRRIYQAAALPDPPLPCEEILAASA